MSLASVADRSTVELTTTGRKSGEPRKVTIWFVVDDGRVYVQSGKEGKTDWFRNLQKTPTVSLAFGSETMRGTAAVVDDPKLAARVHDLFRAKYWMARVGGWIGLGFGKGQVVKVSPLPVTEP